LHHSSDRRIPFQFYYVALVLTLLGWNCGYSFTSNITYGVLYAISPELFRTKDRGTGNALAAAANRIFGTTAPIIALYTNLATLAPIYVSASPVHRVEPHCIAVAVRATREGVIVDAEMLRHV
jgi:hypothetical protein